MASELELRGEQQRVTHEVERLVTAFGMADRQLEQIVREGEGKKGAGYLIRRVRGMMGLLRRRGARDATNILLRAYANGASVVPGGDSSINKEAINVLTEALVNRLGSVATTAEQSASAALRRHVLIHAQAALLERGDARNSIESRLVNALRDEGITAFTDRAGRRWRLETYARMALKTAVSEAQAQGTINTMLATGRDVVRVSSHNCTHHPNDPLHPCRRFEGKTFSLTGTTPTEAVLPSPPPWHPNCTHYLIPAVAAESRVAA